MKKLIKKLMRHSPRAKRLYYAYRRQKAHAFEPDWASVIHRSRGVWDQARAASRGGPRVVLATNIGGHGSAPLMDSLLAVALTLRGADVRFLVCDSFLPACQRAEIGLASPRSVATEGMKRLFCPGCFSRAENMFRPLGLPLHRYSDGSSSDELAWARGESQRVPAQDIERYIWKGVSIGEQSMAGALRYFARSSLEGIPYGEVILRRYFEGALLTAQGVERLMKSHPFDVLSVNHGIYIPHGVVSQMARHVGARVATWTVAYRKQAFIFSHDDTYHHTLMNEPVSSWEKIAWSSALEEKIKDYLHSRRRGGRDWIVFTAGDPTEDLTEIVRSLKGLDPRKPMVGLLTNVAWDAQLHYPANVFENMIEWVKDTISYFSRRLDVQLVIRIHPAEVSGDIPSQQPVTEAIRKAFPTLPPNVFVIPPDSPISTYAVAEACNAVIIYGTKTGVELTSRGIPVVVAGEAWIRGKGMTLDAQDRAHYSTLLDQLPLPGRMSPDHVRRALTYAFHFFFRRMIPLSVVEPTGGEPQFQLSFRSLEDLLPGKDPGLDVICDGLLKGTEFVFPAESALREGGNP